MIVIRLSACLGVSLLASFELLALFNKYWQISQREEELMSWTFITTESQVKERRHFISTWTEEEKVLDPKKLA